MGLMALEVDKMADEMAEMMADMKIDKMSDIVVKTLLM